MKAYENGEILFMIIPRFFCLYNPSTGRKKILTLKSKEKLILGIYQIEFNFDSLPNILEADDDDESLIMRRRSSRSWRPMESVLMKSRSILLRKLILYWEDHHSYYYYFLFFFLCVWEDCGLFFLSFLRLWLWFRLFNAFKDNFDFFFFYPFIVCIVVYFQVLFVIVKILKTKILMKNIKSTLVFIYF